MALPMSSYLVTRHAVTSGTSSSMDGNGRTVVFSFLDNSNSLILIFKCCISYNGRGLLLVMSIWGKCVIEERERFCAPIRPILARLFRHAVRSTCTPGGGSINAKGYCSFSCDTNDICSSAYCR